MRIATPSPAGTNLRKDLLMGVALATAYFVAGKMGLRLASVNPSATAVWAPTGITVAAFLMLGYRVWPGILLGAFLVNATTAGSLATSLAIAAGNTSEGLLGAWLVNRYAGGRNAFDRARDIFRFAFLAGMVCTVVSATIGVTGLALAGFAEWAAYGGIWLTWWLGDAVGAIVVAPPVILWTNKGLPGPTRKQVLEGAALLLYLFLVGQVVFGSFFQTTAPSYPLEFLCVPFLVWAAFRFGQRVSSLAVLLLAGVAIWGTLQGSGPFVRTTQNESLLLLQSFVGIMSLMTLTLAAEVAEHKRAEEEVRRLATTDPLTGLANYRQLTQVLEAEIKRSDRTGRPFALLLLDMDGLKKVNDTQGHLAGSRALCRVADAVRAQSREIDTAARYGGDEFALILPESNADAARQVARRIGECLAGDSGEPRLTVSFGVSQYPRDGASFEPLVRTADSALYEMKSQRRVRGGVLRA